MRSLVFFHKSIGCGLQVLALSAAMAACGGGAQPAKTAEPPPSLAGDTGEGAGPAAAASSPEVQRGIDAIQAGDFAGAKAALSEARRKNPKDAQAAFYLGVAHENLTETEDAKQEYRAALELEPALVEASVNLSALLMESGDAKAALEVARAGLKQAPEHPALLMNEALALEAVGDDAAAVIAYGKAVEKSPENVELRYAYAELLAKAGKKNEALAQIEQVASTDDPRLLLAAGALMGKLGAFDACVRTLDRAIAKQATPDLLVRRGACRHEQQDERGAQSDYEAALKLDAHFAPAHFYLGQHLRAQKKKKEAQAELQKAAELGKGTPIEKAARAALEELKSGK